MKHAHSYLQLRELRRYSAVILMLAFIGIFLWVWPSTERQARSTAIELAAKTMQDNMNAMHQYWLMNRFPASMVMNQRTILLDKQGWPVVQPHSSRDCRNLLAAVLPEQSVFNQPVEFASAQMLNHNRNELNKNAVCYFSVNETKLIMVSKNKGLLVSVILLT